MDDAAPVCPLLPRKPTASCPRVDSGSGRRPIVPITWTRMAIERRKSARIRTSSPCRIVASRGTSDGVVLDMSEGGLSVRTSLKVDQGEPIQVHISKSRGELTVDALVWHLRRRKVKSTGKPCFLLGLMLTAAPSEYLELLPKSRDEVAGRARSASRANAVSAPEPEVADGDDEGEQARDRDEPDVEAPGLQAFRIQIKHRSGPRTRVLSLSAESEAEAREMAASKMLDDWELIGISAVRCWTAGS